MGKADFRFAGLCAVLLTIAMLLISWIHNLPMRDPDGGWIPFSIRLPMIVVIAWLLDVLPRAIVRTGRDWRSAPRRTREVVTERWTRDHLIFAVTGLAAWYACYATFRNLKSFVPFVNDRIHDEAFARLDRLIWFGHDPAAVLHSLFGTGLAAEFFSAIYVIWLGLIPVSLAIALMWTRAPAAGSWFVTAIAVDWMLGVAVYFAMPTLGPIYSRPEMFEGLRRTFTTTLEDNLLRDRLDVLADPHASRAVQTIAAFPSLHVGVMVTVCLLTMYLGFPRWMQVVAWAFLALTVLATVYLGWHFFLDAVGGALVGTAAVWIAAWGTGNHVRGRPRLVDRGTHDAAAPPSTDPAAEASLKR